MMPVRRAVERDDIGAVPHFENTVEVGGAELRGGMLGEKSSVQMFIFPLAPWVNVPFW